MSKTILIVVIVVLLVIVIVGIYAIMSYNNKMNATDNQAGAVNNFEIQGMKVEIVKQGSGVVAKTGDFVTTHYVGTLADGKEFDSSVKRNIPFSFQLGANRVIKGWDLGVTGMKVGEQRKLTIPYELAYGADGFPPNIPQKATLTFVISLLAINPGQLTQ